LHPIKAEQSYRDDVNCSWQHETLGTMELFGYRQAGEQNLRNKPDTDIVNILSQNPKAMSTGERLCQK
jgi:hypothetical protein